MMRRIKMIVTAALCGAVLGMLTGCGTAAPQGQSTTERSEVVGQSAALGQSETANPGQQTDPAEGIDGAETVREDPGNGSSERVTSDSAAIMESNPESERSQKDEDITTAPRPAAMLPSRYDGREHGKTTPVKDQGDQGTCWSFASLLALESSLLPGETYDFSEDHMVHNPSFARGEEGGDYTMSMAYLLSWKGPVLESEDPYGDGISPQELAPAKHVQEIQILPERDREAIKRGILTTGGVQSSLYTTLRSAEDQSEYYNMDTKSYCCPEDVAPNHDVVIVGWDDAFPAENFSVPVPGNGAFLCENSWGTQFGEDGFFYVSYYDANLGKTNLLYSGIENTDNYDHIYQSDLCGWIGQVGYGEETVWAANVYTAGAGSEEVRAAGFYATGENTRYEVYVVQAVPENPMADSFRCMQLRRKVAAGSLEHAGFYTISFDRPLEVTAGQRFAVMVKLVTPGAIHPIAIEYDAGDGKCVPDLTDGEGYISLDGERWESVEAVQACNLCLKAYSVNN